MTNQGLESISVNEQTIYWAVRSGVAVGVQKYTKTHVTGGYGDSAPSSQIETIIEFSLQQESGNEIEMKFRREDIRVRDGQRVSAVFGYTESKSSYWLIFINHDSKKWYWVDTPYSFFRKLEIFVLLSDWWIAFFLAVTVISLAVSSEWAIFGIIVGISGIIFPIIQRCRCQLAWKMVEPQIIKILSQLR